MARRASVGANDPEEAPTAARAEPIAGELVTETFPYDGDRQVTVYVPPGPPEAVVLAGDGQLISQWGRWASRSQTLRLVGLVESSQVVGGMGAGTHE